MKQTVYVGKDVILFVLDASMRQTTWVFILIPDDRAVLWIVLLALELLLPIPSHIQTTNPTDVHRFLTRKPSLCLSHL